MLSCLSLKLTIFTILVFVFILTSFPLTVELIFTFLLNDQFPAPSSPLFEESQGMFGVVTSLSHWPVSSKLVMFGSDRTMRSHRVVDIELDDLETQQWFLIWIETFRGIRSCHAWPALQM